MGNPDRNYQEIDGPKTAAWRMFKAKPAREQALALTRLSQLPPDFADGLAALLVDPKDKPAKALAKLVRAATDDGKLILKFYLRILLDEGMDVRVRAQAADALMDRGFGKTPQEIHVDGSIDHNLQSKLTGLSDEELAELDTPADLDKFLGRTIEADPKPTKLAWIAPLDPKDIPYVG